MVDDLSGRCFCGKVTWHAPGPVLWAGHCHCESCRRATSAPFTSFFGVRRDSVTWQGELAVHPSSDDRVRRMFCPSCGSQMSYQFVGWPAETHLYAATLDDPTKFEPREHYHYGERLPWISLADDLPKHEASADG